MSNIDFEKIDNPYDYNLNRANSDIFSMGGQKFNSEGLPSVDASEDKSSDSKQGPGAGSTPEGNPAVPIQEDLWISSWIKSRNYKPKSQGFLIDGKLGYIECMKLYVGTGGIIGGSLDIPDTTTSNSFHVDTAGLLWSGANIANKTTAPARINPTGEITLGNPTGVHLQLSGPNIRIRSSNYVAGMAGSGFNLDPNLLEVGNISARGMIRTAVFQKNVISSIGGSFMVIDSDVLDSDTTALDASTLTVKGTTTFAVGDILRIKDGIDDEWLEVTNIASAPTYTVIRDKAATYAADSNPVWKKGAAVVNYRQSAAGGVYMTASDTNAPYLSIFTHAGSPWSSLTTRLRIGNLNGYLSYATNVYGIGIGDDNNYFKYDPTTGFTLKGTYNTDISFNLRLGTLAGATLTTGMENVLLGQNAGGSLLGGSYNVCAGTGAGSTISTQNYNTFVGQGAGGGAICAGGVCLGANAGYNVTANYIVCIGYESGFSSTAADHCLFIGYQSGYTNIIGDYNTFVGSLAGKLNTATGNSFFGYAAGTVNSTATQNSFFGTQSGQATTNGGANSFFGWQAGYANIGGGSNCFYGSQAGNGNTTGNSNVFIGVQAGSVNTIGGQNVLIGLYADCSVNHIDNSIGIGTTATVTDDNQCVIGGESDGKVTNFYLGSGVTNNSPVATTVQSTGGRGTNIAGAALNIGGGKSTGNADGGAINLQISIAGASGTGLNGLTTKMIIDKNAQSVRTTDSPTFATVNIIKSSIAGFTANGSSFLTVQNNGVAYIEIGTPNNNIGRLLFSDPEGASGQVVYNHSTNTISFNTNDAERMSIDSAGNVGIGMTSVTNFGTLQVYGTGNQTADQVCTASFGSGAESGLRLYVGVNNTNDYCYIGSVKTGIHHSDLILNPVGANVALGGTAVRNSTVGSKVLNIFNGTAPVGTLANGISIYSSSGECYIMDAAGNATLQSPHDKNGEWIFYSKNTVTGKILKVDMEKLVKYLDKKFKTNFVREYLTQ